MRLELELAQVELVHQLMMQVHLLQQAHHQGEVQCPTSQLGQMQVLVGTLM